jgi:hypothetical protein
MDGCVCPAVHVFQLENGVADFDKILYEHYAIEDHPKFEIRNFCKIGNCSVADARTCEVEATLAPVPKCNNHVSQY